MSDIDISNGTCYTAAGQKLDSSFIPCGNTAFGYQTCCGAGDNCLADLACFGIHGTGYGSYLTYFAGCTDPDYQDASCPKKEIDQPWVALTLCDNSDGAWAICSQSGDPTTLQPGASCSCTNSASATIAFKDATVLANYASLPASTGESISFFAGHSPTGSPTGGSGNSAGGGSTATSSSASDASSTLGTRTTATASSGSGSPSSDSSASASASSSSTSSAGAGGQNSSPGGQSKSGIGTGVIVGIVIGAVAALLVALIAFLLYRRSRRRSQIVSEKKSRESAASTSPMKPGGLGEYVRPTTPPVPEVDGAPVSEIAGEPAKPWMLRSELDGTEIPSGRSSMLGKSNETDGRSTPHELP